MDLSQKEMRRLCDMFAALHDGRLSQQDVRGLEKTILESRAARRLYVRYIRICAGVSWASGNAPQPSSTLDDMRISSEQQGDQIGTIRSEGITALTDDKALALPRGGGSQLLLSLQQHPVIFGFAAILFLVLLVGSFPRGKNVNLSSDQSLDIAKVEERVPAFEPGGIVVDSGSMLMQIPNVGEMSVYGPADFIILDPMRIRLNFGRLEVHVTQESGYGFAVETPGGEVVDLGTKFLLNVDAQQSTSLAVLEGKVDLHTSGVGEKEQVERFEKGEGVLFGKAGNKSRFMSLVANDYIRSTFNHVEKSHSKFLITNVTDNLALEDIRNFYEIVPGGFDEDSPAYVDRIHQWNGFTSEGLPQELIGADYVRTFNDNKYTDSIEIYVEVSRPCTLYIFLDRRCLVPDWIKNEFHETGLKVGIDEGGLSRVASSQVTEVGPGESIDDYFFVWSREIDQPGIVRLGSQRPNAHIQYKKGKGTLGDRLRNSGDVRHTNMYGIAAIAKEG